MDTNIVFSATHTSKSLTRQHLLTVPIHFITCNFLFFEIFRHKERIFKNSRASEEEIYDYLEKVLSRLHFFNEELIGIENHFRAYHLCKDIDIKDTAYVAVPLQFGFSLVTRDKPLHTGLRRKGFRNVLLFNEFLDSI